MRILHGLYGLYGYADIARFVRLYGFVAVFRWWYYRITVKPPNRINRKPYQCASSQLSPQP